MIGREAFLELMNRRYACKSFDTGRPLDKADISFILECGRLSPSSFGLEHWHFFALTSTDKMDDLHKVCFFQEAVRTASLAVVTVCRRAPAYQSDGPFVATRGSRFPGGLKTFVEDYRPYYEYLRGNALLDQWARAQCYIACANMMSASAAIGVDSCAIEGFDGPAVLELLGLDAELWQTAIITVFGYCAGNDNREKIRMPASEIITYVG